MAAVLYALAALFLIFRAGMFQWFWGSVMLWLATGYLGSLLLPGIWGFTRVGPLFIPHFYLTFSALFFFVDFWQKTPDSRFWQADGQHVLLSLFAVSNAIMTLAFMILAGVVWFQYPGGLSVLAFPALLKLYALKPVYWFILQMVLMAVFYLHRVKMMHQPGYWFSRTQLQGGLLLALVCQAVVMMAILLEGRLL